MIFKPIFHFSRSKSDPEDEHQRLPQSNLASSWQQLQSRSRFPWPTDWVWRLAFWVWSIPAGFNLWLGPLGSMLVMTYPISCRKTIMFCLVSRPIQIWLVYPVFLPDNYQFGCANSPRFSAVHSSELPYFYDASMILRRNAGDSSLHHRKHQHHNYTTMLYRDALRKRKKHV